MPAPHEYTVTVMTDNGLMVERRLVTVTSHNPHENVLQAVTGALAALRQDMQLPPVAAPVSEPGFPDYRAALDHQISHCPVCQQPANPFTHECPELAEAERIEALADQAADLWLTGDQEDDDIAEVLRNLVREAGRIIP